MALVSSSMKAAPRSGPFAVCLPGAVSIEETDLSKISALYPTGKSDGSYIVEFKDEATARWYGYENQATPVRSAASWLGSASNETLNKKSEAAPMPEGLVPPQPSAMPMPFQKSKSKMTPAAPKKEPSQPPMPAQTGHTVDVAGLPQHLMSQSMMEAMLDQAKLDTGVVSFTLSKPDKARLLLSSHEAAVKCLMHFHGRSWNVQGAAVVAKIVTKDTCPGRLDDDARHHKHRKDVKAPSGRTVVTSDASTTVSDEDPDQDWWSGELKWSSPDVPYAQRYMPSADSRNRVQPTGIMPRSSKHMEPMSDIWDGQHVSYQQHIARMPRNSGYRGMWNRHIEA